MRLPLHYRCYPGHSNINHKKITRLTADMLHISTPSTEWSISASAINTKRDLTPELMNLIESIEHRRCAGSALHYFFDTYRKTEAA